MTGIIENMKITTVGMGYVCLSLACLFAKSNSVMALDIVANKINAINNGRSPIKDSEISRFWHLEVVTSELL